MSFLKKLASLFSGGGGGDNRALPIYVFSNRCREPIMAEIDLVNSLSRDEENDDKYYTRKVLQGSGRNRCFTQVEVEIWFDRGKKVSHYEVSGGRWLTQEEYEEELIRFEAPSEDENSADGDSQ
ncbi:MAG: hypothetical protein OXG26_02805 [Caldilineaceae bacterium]|nr:hypothetical protein [Caldilineaceae bacterium]MDE0633402.1 hypothetical protein [Caldilineaceae bacterium]